VVSHDRYFLNHVCNSICVFEDGDLVRYYGDYDDYREQRDAKIEAERASSTPAAPDKPATSEPEPAKPNERKGLSWKEKQRLEAIQEEIGEAEAKKAKVEAALADPDLYSSRTDEIAGLNADLRDVTARLEALYEEWEGLEARRL
jgi:ATPase subunit of ABC transporter with duplicated ATPase domains